jgi:hypothetical protein
MAIVSLCRESALATRSITYQLPGTYSISEELRVAVGAVACIYCTMYVGVPGMYLLLQLGTYYGRPGACPPTATLHSVDFEQFFFEHKSLGWMLLDKVHFFIYIISIHFETTETISSPAVKT